MAAKSKEKRNRPSWSRAIVDHVRELRSDQGGSVLIELAFALPILIIIILGCVDATRFILINQKIDRVAVAMADLVSQPETISQAQLDDIFIAADQIAFPFSLQTSGRVIVSSVTRPIGQAAQIDWQELDDSSLSATSNVGAAGGNATLPTGFTVRESEGLIVAEVFFSYQPMFLDTIFEPRVLVQTAIRRPRLGDLSTLN